MKTEIQSHKILKQQNKMPAFGEKYSFYQKTFEDFLERKNSQSEALFAEYFSNQKNSILETNSKDLEIKNFSSYPKKITKFYESVRYSIEGTGKRFRPVISLAVSEMLGGKASTVLPWAMAIEMIHTYSLIHDDLPCMDNDDERRGRPTNHKVYGESTALLAGDALLTDAFKVALEGPASDDKKIQCLKLLVDCAGTLGMVGGQYVDLSSQKNKVSVEELMQMQVNKTGALIRASIVGSAILSGANEKQISLLEKFSLELGLCFQIADDILDHDKGELGSFVGLLGMEKAKELLETLTKKSVDSISDFEDSDFLSQISLYNSTRLK